MWASRGGGQSRRVAEVCVSASGSYGDGGHRRHAIMLLEISPKRQGRMGPAPRRGEAAAPASSGTRSTGAGQVAAAGVGRPQVPMVVFCFKRAGPSPGFAGAPRWVRGAPDTRGAGREGGRCRVRGAVACGVLLVQRCRKVQCWALWWKW